VLNYSELEHIAQRIGRNLDINPEINDAVLDVIETSIKGMVRDAVADERDEFKSMIRDAIRGTFVEQPAARALIGIARIKELCDQVRTDKRPTVLRAAIDSIIRECDSTIAAIDATTN